MAASNEWGRVDDDGAVYVRTADGERSIGSWQAGTPDEGLAHYTRRYDDLATEVTLLEQRLASGAGDPKHTSEVATGLRDGLGTASALGDLPALRTRLDGLLGQAKDKQAAVSAAKAEQRVTAVAAKEKLAAEAEGLATSTQWKATGDRLRVIVEDWKAIKGVDRRTDDALWKRFSAARDAFGKARGTHFADLDRQREVAKTAKLAIVAEAQELATSTDWAPTASKMKSLMSRWKAAGHAPREVEDELWTSFRAAQDAFFAARSEVLVERDTAQVDNQRAKEALLDAAEKLDPDSDLEGAKGAMRDIQDKWEAIGHVPRDVIRRLDDRLKAVEQDIRGAEEERWDRASAESNPLLKNLSDAVVKAERVLTKAAATGDQRKIDEARQAVEAKREWLAEAQRSVRRS